jgi:hypothetical protein
MTARILIISGLTLAALGGLIWLIERLGLSFGQLPGNLRIQFGNLTCVFALGTSLVISILLTVGLNILIRIFNR